MSWDFYNSRIFLFQKEISRYQKGVPEELEQRSGAPFIFPISIPIKIQPPKIKEPEGKGEKYLKEEYMRRAIELARKAVDIPIQIL